MCTRPDESARIRERAAFAAGTATGWGILFLFGSPSARHSPGAFAPRQCEEAVEMDARTQIRLKAQLEAELMRLEAEVSGLEAADRDTISEASGENAYRDHMADQGSATFERELDMTLEENLREALKEVRGALARIEDGTYGQCERCSVDIPIDRMDAVPTASLCIVCKSADEHR